MSLKITSTSGTFNLPSDFSIEIEDTSPIYNERGSQSTAATLPSSPKNLTLTSHIGRLDTDHAPAEDARVVVSDGVYRRVGKMNITQASKAGGIVSNIGFDESETYSIWNAVSLRALKDLPIYKPAGGITDVIAYLNDIMNEKRTDTPLHVFPICVSMPSKTDNNQETYYPEYLNRVIEKSDKSFILNSDKRIENYLINSEVIATSLPAGYGLTPFLKVSWILETIFSKYGYKIIENPFCIHPQLSRLIVLNNTADACVKGFINYSDLMPDCTINEFLQALYCRFGMIYFVDGKTKNVKLKFLKDIIRTPASQDWTNLKASSPIINYNAPQQLKLSAGTSIAGPYKVLVAAPSVESLDKFLKQYDYIVSTNYDKGFLYWSNDNGIYFVRNIITKQLEPISSDFFPWDKGDKIGYEEISSIDECLPIKGSYPDDVASCPAYLLGKVHRYTNIASADIELSEDQETKTPLCFCFSMPITSIKRPYGSPRCTGPGGAPVKDPSGHTFDISMVFVGDNGLFNHFWRDYDAVLRHANHTVETELHLSANQLLNTDVSDPILISGQRLLIDTTRYVIPFKGKQPATVNLRTLKLLQPYDLEKEQTIKITEQLYYWDLFNNRESIVGSAIASQVNYWKSGLRPPSQWMGTLRKNEVSDTTSPAEIPFSVPTKEDFDTNRTIFIKQIHYSFDLYYKVMEYSGNKPNLKEYGGVHYDVVYNLFITAKEL